MASTINTANIDENYPVAGQDNDSQGFRDNFQNIKTALGVAKSEITTLQDNSLDLTTDNSFSGNTISDVTLRDAVVSAPSAIAITTTTSEVDFTQGSYVRLRLTVDSPDENLVTFSNWGPANTMSHMRIEVVMDDAGDKILRFTVPSGNVWKKQSTPGSANSLTNPYTLTDVGARYIFDVWSADQGTNVFVALEGIYKT